MNNLPSLPQPLKPSRRRIGKVARLPKEVRDHLNGSTSLQRVEFVLFDSPALTAFERAFAAMK